MRVALVITELDPGGAELCLTELALFLNRLGHTVQVWAIGSRPSPGRDRLLQRLASADINVQFGNASRWHHIPRTVRWLHRELRDFRPDVVQSMLWHANMITAGALWFRSVPWVGGMRVSEPRRWRWRLERVASRRMQRLVCVSQDVYEHAVHKEAIAPAKLAVIPNGVAESWLAADLPPGNWHQLIGHSPSHVMLFVGRLEPQKGVLPLIEHASELLSQSDPWSLVLIGQGSLQSELEERLAGSQLQANVHLAGWQPEAAPWMKAAGLLVLPAQYEGMPNVLLEVMAVGRPFVAFAVDGVRQLLCAKDGYPAQLAASQLAAPGDWTEFVRLVNQQVQQPDLRLKCGLANRAHVAQHFRLEDQLSKYLQLYQSLIAASGTITR